jgi:putative membrane protein
MFVKPIIKVLTLPINILTLGLFSLFINGAIFWYLGSGLIRGFSVRNFTAAFVGAIVVSIINWILVKIFKLDW